MAEQPIESVHRISGIPVLDKPGTPEQDRQRRTEKETKEPVTPKESQAVSDFRKQSDESLSFLSRSYRAGGVGVVASIDRLDTVLEESLIFLEQRTRDLLISEAGKSRDKGRAVGFTRQVSGVLGFLNIISEEEEKEAIERVEERNKPLSLLDDPEYKRLQEENLKLVEERSRLGFMLQYFHALAPGWALGEFDTFESSLTSIDGFDLIGAVQGGDRSNRPSFNIQNLSDVERSTLRSWYDEIIAVIPQMGDESKYEDIARIMIQKPRPKATVLGDMTEEEVRKALNTRAAIQLPAGITLEEVVQMLKEQATNSPEFNEAFEETKTMWLELGELYTTQRLAQEALKARLIDPSLPELTNWETIKLAALQPALVISGALTPYFENVSQPWAAFALTHNLAPLGSAATGAAGGFGIAGPKGAIVGGVIFGLAGLGAQVSFGNEMREIIDGLRREGKGGWSIYNEGYEQWDTPIGWKIATEGVLDPINIFGMNVIGRLTVGNSRFARLSLKAPYIGRPIYTAGVSLGKFEQGFIRFTDDAFKFFLPQQAGVIPVLTGGGAGVIVGKATGNIFFGVVAGLAAARVGAVAYNLVPRTLTQAANAFASDATAALMRLARVHALQKSPGKYVYRSSITVRQMLESYDIAVTKFINNKKIAHTLTEGSVGRDAWEVGREVIADREFVNLAESVGVVTRVRNSAGDIIGSNTPSKKGKLDLTDTRRQAFHEQIENSAKGGYASFDEAVDGIIKVLGAEDTAANRLIIKEWLEAYHKKTFDRARQTLVANLENNPRDAMNAYSDLARFNREAALRNPIITKYFNDGMANKWMKYVDIFGHRSGANWVERRLVYPFSRKVLLFLNYGLFNIIENAMRAKFAGVNNISKPLTRKGRNEIDAWIINVAGDLKATPLDILARSVDENIGYSPLMAVSDQGETLAGQSMQKEGFIPIFDLSLGKMASFIGGKRAERLIDKYIPRYLQSVQNLNDVAAKIGSSQQSHMVMDLYKQRLTEIAPEHMARMQVALGDIRTSLGGWDISEMQISNLTLAAHTIIMGPRPSEGLRELHMSLQAMEFGKLEIELQQGLAPFTDIDQALIERITDDALTGSLTLDNIDDKFQAYHASNMTINALHKVEVQRILMKDAFMQLSTVSPTSALEFTKALGIIDDLIDSAIGSSGLMDISRKVATEEGHKLSGSGKQALHDENLRIMDDFMVEMTRNVNNALDDLRSTLGDLQVTKNFDPDFIDYRFDQSAQLSTQELVEGQRLMQALISSKDMPQAFKNGVRSVVRVDGNSSYDPYAGRLFLGENDTFALEGTAQQFHVEHQVYKGLIEAEVGRNNIEFFQGVLDQIYTVTNLSVPERQVWQESLNQGVVDGGLIDFLDDLALDLVSENPLGPRLAAGEYLNQYFPTSTSPLDDNLIPENIRQFLTQRMSLEASLLKAYNAPFKSPRAVQVEGHNIVFVERQQDRYMEFFGTGGKIEQSWNDFRVIQMKAKVQKIELDNQIAVAMGFGVVPQNIGTPASGKLSIVDMAKMYGEEPVMDKLSASLVDNMSMTMKTKRDFIAEHEAMAELLAGKQGKRASEFGFGPQELGDFYDTLLQSMGFDPTTATFDSPAIVAMTGMKDLVTQTLQTRKLKFNIPEEFPTKLVDSQDTPIHYKPASSFMADNDGALVPQQGGPFGSSGFMFIDDVNHVPSTAFIERGRDISLGDQRVVLESSRPLDFSKPLNEWPAEDLADLHKTLQNAIRSDDPNIGQQFGGTTPPTVVVADNLSKFEALLLRDDQFALYDWLNGAFSGGQIRMGDFTDSRVLHDALDLRAQQSDAISQVFKDAGFDSIILPEKRLPDSRKMVTVFDANKVHEIDDAAGTLNKHLQQAGANMDQIQSEFQVPQFESREQVTTFVNSMKDQMDMGGAFRVEIEFLPADAPNPFSRKLRLDDNGIPVWGLFIKDGQADTAQQIVHELVHPLMAEVSGLRGRVDKLFPKEQFGDNLWVNPQDTAGQLEEAFAQAFEEVVFGIAPSPSEIRSPSIRFTAAITSTDPNFGTNLITTIRDEFGDILPVVENRWQLAREEAMETAINKMKQELPDYTYFNAFDAMMKRIFPFFPYETQRYPWLIKHMIQNPGATTNWGRYTEASDAGYMPIPGTGLDINPLRGTVWMGGLRRLYKRDYPDYADQYKTPIETMDFISRAGFFGSIMMTAPVALFGAKDRLRQPQRGELLPPFGQTLLGAIVAINPGSNWAKVLTEVIFPDRFRDYRIQDEVTKQGLDGVMIWNKRAQAIPLEEHEQTAWDRGLGRVSLISATLDAQVGIFRMRPEEKTAAYNAIAQAIFELTGVSPEIQEQSRNRFDITGTRWSDIYPMDPLDRYRLREGLEKYKNWLTPGITPLMPSELGRIQIKINGFYDEVDTIWEGARNIGFTSVNNQTGEVFVTHKSLNQLEVELRSSLIGMKEYLRNVQRTVERATIAVEALSQTEYYKDVPKTRSEREAHYARSGTPVPTFSAGQELLWEYFALRPKLTLDEFGVERPDFDRYFLEIETLLASIAPEERHRLLTRIQIDWTDTQRLHWEINREVMRPYLFVDDVVNETFSDEDQLIIAEFRQGDAGTKQRLRQAEGEEGRGIVAKFEADKAQFRTNLRDLDPTLDAWLLFWAETTTVRTDKARLIYNDLLTTYRPGAEKLEPSK